MNKKGLGWFGFALALIPALKVIPVPQVQVIAGILSGLVSSYGLNPEALSGIVGAVGAGVLASSPKLVGKSEGKGGRK